MTELRCPISHTPLSEICRPVVIKGHPSVVYEAEHLVTWLKKYQLKNPMTNEALQPGLVTESIMHIRLPHTTNAQSWSTECFLTRQGYMGGKQLSMSQFVGGGLWVLGKVLFAELMPSQFLGDSAVLVDGLWLCCFLCITLVEDSGMDCVWRMLKCMLVGSVLGWVLCQHSNLIDELILQSLCGYAEHMMTPSGSAWDSTAAVCQARQEAKNQPYSRGHCI